MGRDRREAKKKMIVYDTLQSLPAMMHARTARGGDRPFMWAKSGGAWTALSWAETGARMRDLAKGLLDLGIRRGDRVALIAENRPEWVIADYAIMSIGAITVPSYTTNTAEENRHVFANAGVSGAIVSTRALATTAIAAAQRVEGCRFVVAIEPPDIAQHPGIDVVAWNDALARGAARADDIDAIVATLRRDDIACIIHTSGTGGLPKGVALHHGAMLRNCDGAYHLLREIDLQEDAEIYLSFLPMSHSYEHTAGGVLMPSMGAQVYFAEGIDKLSGNLQEVRPTIMTAVPRLYETMHARISAQMSLHLARDTLFLGLYRFVGQRDRVTPVGSVGKPSDSRQGADDQHHRDGRYPEPDPGATSDLALARRIDDDLAVGGALGAAARRTRAGRHGLSPAARGSAARRRAPARPARPCRTPERSRRRRRTACPRLPRAKAARRASCARSAGPRPPCACR